MKTIENPDQRIPNKERLIVFLEGFGDRLSPSVELGLSEGYHFL